MGKERIEGCKGELKKLWREDWRERWKCYMKKEIKKQ